MTPRLTLQAHHLTSVHRAWYMIGISIRYAQAAGLHLRNEDITIPINKKRATAQTWWALHSIECILTSITGRPRVIERKDCTVPLPSNSREEQPSGIGATPGVYDTQARFNQLGASAREKQPATSSAPSASNTTEFFLDAWTRLDLLQHKTLSTLYAARTVVRSWRRMQGDIASLLGELDDWAKQAFAHDSSEATSTAEPNSGRQRLMLYCYYQSAKICASRPCLCRLDQRIKGQSEQSANFNQNTATVCVQAAIDLTSCLPDPASPRWLYENGPWWSGVHIIMQAVTVLLLEMAQGTSRADPAHVVACVEKLTQWLQTMANVDNVADRAYGLVCKMLNKDKQDAVQPTVRQWPEGTVNPSDLESGFASDTAPQSFDPNVDYYHPPDKVWPSGLFDQRQFTQTNAGPFDMNLLANPLYDSHSNFQFQQESPYPFYYGNLFSTEFDETLDYEHGGGAGQADWSTKEQEVPR